MCVNDTPTCSRVTPPCPARRKPTQNSPHLLQRSHTALPMLTLCLLAAVFHTGAARSMPDLASMPTPPSFVHHANPPILWFNVASDADSESMGNDRDRQRLRQRTFRCEATGIPRPTYSWTKDGVDFPLDDTNPRLKLLGAGTFELRSLQKSDQGLYQCSAKNGNGTAVDEEVALTQTVAGPFIRQEPMLYEVNHYDPFEMQCRPPVGKPEVHVNYLLKGGGDEYFYSINESHVSIVQLESEGQGWIFFSYVTQNDTIEKKNLFYTCSAMNPVLKSFFFGDPFGFKFKDGNSRQRYREPQEQFLSKSDRNIQKNSTVHFHCIFSGNPVSLPKWHKDGLDTPVQPSDRITFKNHGRTMVIKEVTDSDAGKYECRFEQKNHLNRKFYISVDAAPYFPVGAEPMSTNSSEGETVEFVCAANGKPSVTYTFKKNGERLFNSDRVEIDGKVLRIKNLRKRNDATGEEGDNGVYQCVAKNEHGSVQANFYLNLMTHAPVVLAKPSPAATVLGNDTRLAVDVFAAPRPDITWSKKDEETGEWNKIDTNKADKFVELIEGGGSKVVLKIKDPKHEDQGEYKFELVNQYGTDEGTIPLDVKEQTIISRGPLDAFGTTAKDVQAGHRIELPCDVSHDPDMEPAIIWTKDGEPISKSDARYEIKQTGSQKTLILNRPDSHDSGTYICTVETDLDRATEHITFNFIDVPHHPNTVRMQSCNENTADLRWVFDLSSEQLPLLGYTVQYHNGRDDGDWTNYPPIGIVPYTDATKNGNFDEPSTTVSLPPWGDYKFQVRARNKIGESDPTKSNRTCTILSKPPDVNPVVLEAKGNTPDNLIVSWQPLRKDQQNGPDFKYKVRYRPVNRDGDGSPQGGPAARPSPSDANRVPTNDGWKEKEVKGVENDHVVIDGLPSYEPYEVQVASENDKGPAPIKPSTTKGYTGSEAIFGTKLPSIPAIPDPPGNFHLKEVQNGNIAVFEWKPIDTTTFKGDFKGYKIVHWHDPDSKEARRRRRRSANGDRKKEAYFDKDAKEGKVYELEPFSENYAKIMAYNDAGDGKESPVITFTMPPGVPSAPTNFEARALPDNKLGLWWEPPKEKNGVHHGYEVEVKEVESEWDGKRVTADKPIIKMTIKDPDQQTFKLDNPKLEPGTKYEVSVRGLTYDKNNASQTGEPAVDVAETIRSDADTKSAPLEAAVKNVELGRDHINVTLIPGAYDSAANVHPGEITGIETRKKGTDDWTLTKIDDDFTVTVPKLEPGTEYEMKVISRSVSDPTATTASAIHVHKTMDEPWGPMSPAWIIALIVIILLLLILLLICCLVMRHRGAKYPVQAKERAQGREPMLPEDKGFGEYHKPGEDERRSLTGSAAISETDSMAEYGDGDVGKFTEDGSFIGQYGGGGAPNKNFKPDDVDTRPGGPRGPGSTAV